VIRGKTAAGHNAVQVRVVQQVLPPGMQHGEKADAGAQMLGSPAMVSSVSAVARNRML
jgi:hypothetical protein